MRMTSEMEAGEAGEMPAVIVVAVLETGQHPAGRSWQRQ